MSNDVEWGPWIGWNGGECPVGLSQVIEGIYHNGDRIVQIKCIGDDFIWNDHPYATIAYRVKKEPVIEVVHREVRVVEANEYIMTIAHDATCTYTDGKLTKIHWEAGE